MSTASMNPSRIFNPLNQEDSQFSRRCSFNHVQQQQQQEQDTDIARVSFYLRCCVVGCALANESIPMQLLDFTNVHSLPLQYQNLICQLAFGEEYGLCNLLGRIIHVDTNNQVLPRGTPMLFLQAGTPEFHLAMNLLGVHSINLPAFYNGNIIICSSEWLQTYHIEPFQRYMGNLLAVSNNNILAGDEQVLQPLPESYDYYDSTTTKKAESNVQYEFGDEDDDEDMINIPIAAAVRLDVPPKPSVRMIDDEYEEEEEEDVSASLIIPGQQVRLYGLENQAMNGLMGIVKSRKDNRIIVKVPNHKCKFSVRLENLAIVVQEAVAVAC